MLHRLERLEVIELIVTQTDRDCQGDFEEDMLRDQLDEMSDRQLEDYQRSYVKVYNKTP
jgi:hypothetical protein